MITLKSKILLIAMMSLILLAGLHFTKENASNEKENGKNDTDQKLQPFEEETYGFYDCMDSECGVPEGNGTRPV